MNIRKMVFSDLPQVLPLAEQLGYSCSLPELNERFINLSNDLKTGLYVGETQDQIIAFMQIQETSTLMTGRRAELNAIVVDKGFRGKGAGREMMVFAEKWVKAKGLPKLRLGSKTSRTDTHEFYKRIGFTIEKSWYVFGKSVN